MTPEKFKEEVQKLVDNWEDDPEAAHSDFDGLCEAVLRSLGYGEGIDLTQGCTFWCA